MLVPNTVESAHVKLEQVANQGQRNINAHADHIHECMQRKTRIKNIQENKKIKI